MTFALIATQLKRFGLFLIGNRVSQIALLVILVICYHLAKVKSAQRKGGRKEREKALEQAIKKAKEIGASIQERRQEVREDIEIQREADRRDPRKRFTDSNPFD